MDFWKYLITVFIIDIVMDCTESFTFLVRPQNATMRIGDTLSLECIASESTLYYTWEYQPHKDSTNKEGQVLGFCYKGRQCVVRTWVQQVKITNTSLLVVHNLSSGNGGQYICETAQSSGYEIIKSSAWVVVQTPPKSISIEFDKSQNIFTENELVRIKCSVSGSNPPPTVDISVVVNNKVSVLKVDPASQSTQNTDEFSVLASWRPSYLQHRGFVMCSATNSAGSVTGNSSRVNIKFEPKIYPFKSNNISALVNHTVDLNCQVVANPPATIQWFINNGLRRIASPQLITTVQPEMAGNVTCMARNSMGSRSQTLKLVVLMDPVILINSRYNIKEKSDGSISCQVNAIPEPDFVRWYKVSSESHRSPTLISDDAKLNFIKIDRSSSGKYVCVTKNTQIPTEGRVKEVTIKKQLELIVTYAPGEPLIKSEYDVKVLKGDQLRLLCSANIKNPGEPYPTMSWIDIDTTDTVSTGPEYIVEKAGPGNNGIYQCVAKNELGLTLSSKSVAVSVHESPKLLSHQAAHVFLSHSSLPQTLSFPCTFQGHPLQVVHWNYLGTRILPGSPYHITTHRTISQDRAPLLTSNLTIKVQSSVFTHNSSSKLPPSGVFSCDTTNQYGSASFEYYLVIRYPPLIRVSAHERKVAGSLRQDYVSIKCHIESIGESQVAWFRNSDQMEIYSMDRKYSVITSDVYRYNSLVDVFSPGVKVSEMKIFDLLQDDFTVYACVASNDQGSTKGLFELVFKSKPDAPYDIRITNIEWDSVTISWRSGFNGGIDQSFEIQMYSDSFGTHNVPFYSDKIENKLTLKGLHPRTNYSVQIYSINTMGRSGGSDIIDCVTNRVTKFDRIRARILPRELKVAITVPDMDLCANVDYSRDNGRQWFNIYHCIKFNSSQVNRTVFLDISQLPSTYDPSTGTVQLRVAFCLLSRPGICSIPVILENPKHKNIATQTVILVIAVICVVLIIILIVLFVICCARFKYSCSMCGSYCSYFCCCHSKYQRPKLKPTRSGFAKRTFGKEEMMKDGRASCEENFDDTLITMGSPSKYCSSLMSCSSPHQLQRNHNDIYSSFTCQHQVQPPVYYEGSSFLQPTLFSWPQNLNSQAYEVSSSNSHSSAGSSNRTNNPKSCLKYRTTDGSLSNSVIVNQKSLMELNEKIQLPDVTSQAIHFVRSSDIDHVLEAIV